MSDIYTIIMAGGIGSRFWPMSRQQRPKQFIDILGTGKSLIRQTFERFTSLCPKENIYVVTNEAYRDLVKEHIPELGEDQILGEPARRNTAPCIAYANYKILQRNANANIIVAPADHLILKEDAFFDTMRQALQQTSKEECLVTLGIKPTRPDTGYGYIQFTDDTGESGLKKVKTFTEKPDLDLAKKFIQSGDFYWNSGIFIWKLQTIMRAFDEYLPEVSELFSEKKQDFLEDEIATIKAIYEMCPNISIDYGIMEKAGKAGKVWIALAEFDWSDLGTWGSLYTHLQHDENHNAVVGKNVMLYDSERCIVNVPMGKLIVLQGLKDYIVVESDDILLVCKKGDEQKIRQFVNDIRSAKGEQYL